MRSPVRRSPSGPDPDPKHPAGFVPVDERPSAELSREELRQGAVVQYVGMDAVRGADKRARDVHRFLTCAGRDNAMRFSLLATSALDRHLRRVGHGTVIFLQYAGELSDGQRWTVLRSGDPSHIERSLEQFRMNTAALELSCAGAIETRRDRPPHGGDTTDHPEGKR